MMLPEIAVKLLPLLRGVDPALLRQPDLDFEPNILCDAHFEKSSIDKYNVILDKYFKNADGQEALTLRPGPSECEVLYGARDASLIICNDREEENYVFKEERDRVFAEMIGQCNDGRYDFAVQGFANGRGWNMILQKTKTTKWVDEVTCELSMPTTSHKDLDDALKTLDIKAIAEKTTVPVGDCKTVFNHRSVFAVVCNQSYGGTMPADQARFGKDVIGKDLKIPGKEFMEMIEKIKESNNCDYNSKDISAAIWSPDRWVLIINDWDTDKGVSSTGWPMCKDAGTKADNEKRICVKA